MDNSSFDIVAEGNDALTLALQLAWSEHPNQKATHYKIIKLRSETKYFGHPTPSWHEERFFVDEKEGVPTLVLMWGANVEALPLPYPLGRDDAIQFVKGWLAQVEYPESPADEDISVDKAWRVMGPHLHRVCGFSSGIVGVQTVWALYGR